MKNKMKKIVLLPFLALSLVGCGENKEELIEDKTPYTFTNPEKEKHAIDSDMTIDGEFNEERWKNVRWLKGVDQLNKNQYAEINFTTSYSDLGVYFGLEVKEHGTNIYVNHERSSYFNSCIEMYLGPANAGKNDKRCFEIDLMADGTYSVREYLNNWAHVQAPDSILPIGASKTIGGEVNTPECTGYTYEIFFPFEYLEHCGYDTSDKANLELGINPVHITSFTYNGHDLNEDRLWSDWSKNYINSEWLTPNSWFIFGKDGYCSYTYTISYDGDGKGIVKEMNNLEYVMKGQRATFKITPVNDATLTKLLFNGEDVTSQVEWSSGIGKISLLFTKDSEIKATFTK